MIVTHHAFNFQQSTKPRPVMVQSVATFVFRRYDHGDHFPLNSAQGTFTVHQLFIQVIVLPPCPAVNTMDPENVVLIRDPVIRRNHFFSYVIDVCHFRLLNFYLTHATFHITKYLGTFSLLGQGAGQVNILI
jgi:hypothetical protein